MPCLARVKVGNFHDIRDVKSAFTLNDLAIGVLLAFAHVPLDHVDPFDDHSFLFGGHGDNPAALAFVGAGNNDDFVVFLNVKAFHKIRCNELGANKRSSDDFRGQGNDFHELLIAQLTSNRPENAGATRIEFLVNNNNGVAVETEVRAITASNRLPGADDHGVDHLALLYRAVRGGFFDMGFDDVANASVALVTAENANRCRALGAGVIRDIQDGTYLQHKRSSSGQAVTGATSVPCSTISTRRQRLVLDSGRVSSMRTRSPTLASL